MRRPRPTGVRRRLRALAGAAGACSLFAILLAASPQPSPVIRAETESAPSNIEALRELFEAPPSSAAPIMR
jgi:hypothetical protein